MRSSYDPRTGEIHCSPGASLYARFHELAHKDQHENGAACYYAWLALRYFRVVGYLSILWIELDAILRARRVMLTLGLWNDRACQEAKNNLISYARMKEIK